LGLGLALEDRRQPGVEVRQALAVGDPLGGGIGPVRPPGAKFVSLLELDEGLCEASLVPQRVAQVAVCLGIARVEVEGLPVSGDGLVQLALPEQRVAAVVDAHGFLPLEADALRGRKFVLLRQDVAEAGVGLGVIFLEAEGLSVGGFCRGPLALLSQHVTEEAVAEGIIGSIANRPPEGGLGLGPLPLLL